MSACVWGAPFGTLPPPHDSMQPPLPQTRGSSWFCNFGGDFFFFFSFFLLH